MAATTDKAWGETSRTEPRWPASIAVVVAAALYFMLPGKFTIGPVWLIPLIEGLVLVPLSIAAPKRRPHESVVTQYAAFSIIAIAGIANITSLSQLIHALIYHGKNVTGPELIVSSIAIWLTNVIVFSLWYYELDRGGPDERLRTEHGEPDFLFPQMSTPGSTRDGSDARLLRLSLSLVHQRDRDQSDGHHAAHAIGEGADARRVARVALDDYDRRFTRG